MEGVKEMNAKGSPLGADSPHSRECGCADVRHFFFSFFFFASSGRAGDSGVTARTKAPLT